MSLYSMCVEHVHIGMEKCKACRCFAKSVLCVLGGILKLCVCVHSCESVGLSFNGMVM